jgi:geranylgeranyl diphosphate synthase type I
MALGSDGVSLPPDAVDPLDVEELRTRVHKVLDDVLAHQGDVLDAVSDDLAPLMDAVGDLLRGGKRLRAAFCYWGWRGAGGEDCPGIVSVSAALEMF